MKRLTTEFGAPVVDNQNIQTAGPRGPALLQDVWFFEKLLPTSIAKSSPSGHEFAVKPMACFPTTQNETRLR